MSTSKVSGAREAIRRCREFVASDTVLVASDTCAACSFSSMLEDHLVNVDRAGWQVYTSQLSSTNATSTVNRSSASPVCFLACPERPLKLAPEILVNGKAVKYIMCCLIARKDGCFVVYESSGGAMWSPCCDNVQQAAALPADIPDVELCVYKTLPEEKVKTDRGLCTALALVIFLAALLGLVCASSRFLGFLPEREELFEMSVSNYANMSSGVQVNVASEGTVGRNKAVRNMTCNITTNTTQIQQKCIYKEPAHFAVETFTTSIPTFVSLSMESVNTMLPFMFPTHEYLVSFFSPCATLLGIVGSIVACRIYAANPRTKVTELNIAFGTLVGFFSPLANVILSNILKLKRKEEKYHGSSVLRNAFTNNSLLLVLPLAASIVAVGLIPSIFWSTTSFTPEQNEAAQGVVCFASVVIAGVLVVVYFWQYNQARSERDHAHVRQMRDVAALYQQHDQCAIHGTQREPETSLPTHTEPSVETVQLIELDDSFS